MPLNLRVRGPGEKPSTGETRLSGTWGVATQVRSPDQSLVDEVHIPLSLGTKGNQEEKRSNDNWGSHPGQES